MRSGQAVSVLGLSARDPGVGAAVLGMLEPPDFVPLEGAIGVLAESPIAIDGIDRSRLGVGFISGGLCPVRVRTRVLHAFGCGISELGAMRVTGESLPRPRAEDTQGFLALGMEGRLTLRLAGPFALRAGVSALVVAVRPRFVYDTADGVTRELFRPALLSTMADLGVGITLP